MRTRWLFSLGLLLPLACSHVDAPSSAEAPLEATQSDEVWPTDKSMLDAESLMPPPPPGASCPRGGRKYHLDLESKWFWHEVCNEVECSCVYGSKTLSDLEMSTLDAAMQNVAISQREYCGADKPFLTIKVTSALQGAKRYVDSYYKCSGASGDGPFVDNIDGVFSAFRNIVAAE
jgi:hypothetical protein